MNKVKHYGLDVPSDLEPYIKMVHAIAKKYYKESNPRIDYDDLVSVGMAALCAAQKTWDADRNPRFSSYGYPHVETAIVKEFQNTINSVSGCTPYHIKNTEGAKEEIEFINSHTVSLQASKKSLEGVESLLPVRSGGRRPTLNEIMVESGSSNPHTNAERLELIEQVGSIVQELDTEAQDIVYRRMYYGDSFQDIADSKAMTWRAVNYSFHKSMEKLKDKFVKVGLDTYA